MSTILFITILVILLNSSFDNRTARPANLQARDWKVNGLGRKVSHSYGFGLMDATAMVRLSKKWTNMPAQVTFSPLSCCCWISANLVLKLVQ